LPSTQKANQKDQEDQEDQEVQKYTKAQQEEARSLIRGLQQLVKISQEDLKEPSLSNEDRDYLKQGIHSLKKSIRNMSERFGLEQEQGTKNVLNSSSPILRHPEKESSINNDNSVSEATLVLN